MNDPVPIPGLRLDGEAILAALAQARRVFYSEADFQFAFAWQAKLLQPHLEVRLETHPETNVRLDLELIDPMADRGTAIELKYMTRLWSGSDGRETYELKNHGASDLRGYDLIKDLERAERFVDARPGWDGYVIALTNEPSYWRPKVHGRATNADAFRVHEGALLHGQRQWGPNTGGTAKGRERPLVLRDHYAAHWTDYSRLDSGPAGTFRVLVVPIRSGSTANDEDSSPCSMT